MFGNFYVREHIFADRWKNRKNSLGTRTNFVPHRSSFPLNISFLDPYSNLFRSPSWLFVQF